MLERLLINIITVTVFFGLGIANTYNENVLTEAIITIQDSTDQITGQYVEKGLQENADGTLIFDKNIDWCNNKLPSSVVSKLSRLPQPKEWIALIPSSINCTCSRKLATAKKNNATAAIISRNGHKDKNKGCEDAMFNIVSVVVGGDNFHKLTEKSLSSETVKCKITRGKKSVEKQFKVSRTSVLFVLVSFILLMCISLAWLVFYYVQRFRHIYRNDRKEKQLLSAAKKAISKLKTISFQAGNKDGEEDSCAVCLENYKDGENIRVLPCKHLFHKACIDPWLLNHRTCPMCKSNILKSLGVEIPDNVDLSQFDVESRRLSREVDNVQSTPAPAVPAEEALPDEHAVPSTSVFSAGDTSQAWSEPNVVSASCCSSTSSMLSDTDSERSTVALVSVVQKV